MGVVGGIPSHHGFAKSSGWSRAAPDTHRPPDFSGRLPHDERLPGAVFWYHSFLAQDFVQNCASFNLALGPQLILFLMISLNSNIEFSVDTIWYRFLTRQNYSWDCIWLNLGTRSQQQSTWRHGRNYHTDTDTQNEPNLACGRADMVGQLGFRRQIKVHPGYSRWYPFVSDCNKEMFRKTWIFASPKSGLILSVSSIDPPEFQPEKIVKTA